MPEITISVIQSKNNRTTTPSYLVKIDYESSVIFFDQNDMLEYVKDKSTQIANRLPPIHDNLSF